MERERIPSPGMESRAVIALTVARVEFEVPCNFTFPPVAVIEELGFVVIQLFASFGGEFEIRW